MKIELSDKEIELLIDSLKDYREHTNFIDRTNKNEIVQEKTRKIVIDTTLLLSKLYKEAEKEKENGRLQN